MSHHEELTDHDMLIRLHEAILGENGVLDQVKKTNGRVTVLEQWKSWIMGALALAGILVVPAVGYVVYQVVTKLK